MKNVINYYFNLYPNTIRQIKNRFHFVVDNEKYYFVPYERSISEIKNIISLNNEIIKRDMLAHEIILNKNKEPITYVNNIPYILMKVYVNELKTANLSDIYDLQLKSSGIAYDPLISRINWFDLWTAKVDYLEYQVSHFGKKNPILNDTVSYFVGLAENAISYIKNASLEATSNMLDNFVVSHRRIEKNATLYDIYNPLNFVLDHKARDLSEYIKINFFNDKEVWTEIYEYFNHNSFSEYGLRIFFGRMLYPSFYFDIFENIVDNKAKEEELVRIIKKTSQYEEFIYDIFYYINKITPIPEVEWLMKR